MRLKKLDKRVFVPFTVSVKKDGKIQKIAATISAVAEEDGEPSFDAISFREIAQTKADALGVLGPFDFERLRNRLKATQSQMALRIFCGAKSYTRWETGRSLPSKMVSLLIKTIFQGELEPERCQTRIVAEFPMEKGPPWQMQTCYCQAVPQTNALLSEGVLV